MDLAHEITKGVGCFNVRLFVRCVVLENILCDLIHLGSSHSTKDWVGCEHDRLVTEGTDEINERENLLVAVINLFKLVQLVGKIIPALADGAVVVGRPA